MVFMAVAKKRSNYHQKIVTSDNEGVIVAGISKPDVHPGKHMDA